MTIPSPIPLLTTAQELLQSGLASSAELLLGYVLSVLPPPTTSDVHAHAQDLLGDCLVESKEFPRALKCYESAVRCFESQENVWRVREKVAGCLVACGDVIGGIDEMERIPKDVVSIKGLRLLAGWYETVFRIEQARDTYLLILQKQPLATEAVLGAIKCGAEPSTMHLPPWVTSYVEGYAQIQGYKYKDAIKTFLELQNTTPLNLHVLHGLSDAYFMSGDGVNAFYVFRQIRKRDPETIRHMDRYASLLASRNKTDVLSKLAVDLVKRYPNHPESWCAMAYYWRSEGDDEKALHFCEKSLAHSPTHPQTHLLKSTLLPPQHALPTLHKTLLLSPTLETYTTLLNIYISQTRYTEALTLVSDLAHRMPSHPPALSLVAKTLFEANQPRKSLSVYQHAFELDPTDEGVCIGYAQVCEALGQVSKAESVLKGCASVGCRVLLAGVLGRAGRVHEGLEVVNGVLVMDPTHPEALSTLDTLHRLVSRPEEDEPPEEDDEDEDERERVEELSNGLEF
ncbi:uncharacterized protein SPPG_02397 [Spizellomyces punctatus DAOM BR117]|uniref:Uncharacterized protein n=1 Tax=Spizellomyces punctatus (strain DAOM BR117) TaxID=645134 RepID=A0A0L0HR61_SPIPD|nr:uncharacterized protein SPPG_02397 [Spizellomyces punctatus DAOM BR117]KND03354.1 hypothetical protein SPPG_02397 [Spizellomyces punctatus DAOM BR117]|eukprot:XP_016611393.1 hypothetical protein SPPG_02397 [Spizellomyces punctatus DAOM BR117]